MEGAVNEKPRQLDTFRFWLGVAPTPVLAEMLSLFRDELAGRLQLDASSYLTRAVACLDAARFASNQPPATTEPPASV